jgi:hypothetical protein
MAKISLKISADYEKDTMTLALVQQAGTVGSITIDIKDAAKIAGNLLATAAKAFELSGKPPPNGTKNDEVSLTAVLPSGHNVGPGRKSKSTMAIFHFGETALGIELPNEDARTLGRRLMTSAADGTAQ